MNETKVKAIVIDSKDYKEKDKLVQLFTLEQGIITTIFKGVKNSNAKLKSAKEIFTFGDFIYINGNFKTVTSADVISNFYDITKNINNYYCACEVLKIIQTVLPKEEPNSELFVETLKVLSALEEKDINAKLIICRFLIKVFEGVGYNFDLGKCNTCGNAFLTKIYMNLKYGDFTCSKCRIGETQEVPLNVYSCLRLISKTDYDKLSTIKLQSYVQDQIQDLLSKNFLNRFGRILFK